MPVGTPSTYNADGWETWLKAKGWFTEPELLPLRHLPTSERNVRLVALLRAKAASTEFPAEREALLAKAAELQAK